MIRSLTAALRALAPPAFARTELAAATLVVAALVPAGFAFVGCSSIVGTENPDVTLSLEGDAEALAGVSGLEVTIAGRRYDLAPGGAGQSVDTEAPSLGDLPVEVVLRNAEGDTLAATNFIQAFRKDHGHWVVGRVGGARPEFFCVGTVEAAPFRAAGEGAAPDTLFVMHGSLPDDAVC